MRKSVIVPVVIILFGSAVGLQAETINGINMNFVSIGSAGYGSSGDTGYVNYDYRIGQTEVSINQFAASGIVVENSNGADHWNALGGDAPAVYLNFHEAARYCNWLTSEDENVGAYRMDSNGLVTNMMSRQEILNDGSLFYVLPTENEWYKAAYFNGSGYNLYSTDDGAVPQDEIDSVFGRTFTSISNETPWLVTDGMQEINGTLNMGGNVWEWLGTAQDGNLDFSVGENFVFRGGSYHQGLSYLGNDTIGDYEPVNAEYWNTGFRVAAIPEPGTIGLVGISALGFYIARALRHRRRFGRSFLR